MSGQQIEALEQQGWQLHHAGQHRAAIEVFCQMLAIDPRNVSALQGKIGSLRRLGCFTEAEDLADRALDWLGSSPESVGILDERGWIDFYQHQFEGAIQAFDRALAIDPQDAGALQGEIASFRSLRQFDRAQALLDEALAAHPAHAGILAEQVWMRFDQQQYERAIEALDRALEASPYDTTLLQGKIAACRLARRFEEAQAAAQQALAHHPESPGIVSESGWLYFAQNQYDRAVEVFDRALELDPRYSAALQGKIAALRLSRQFEPAHEWVAKGLERLANRSEIVAILSERGWLFFDQDQFERADECFRQAIRLAPDWIQLKFSRVEVLLRTGRFHEGGQILEDLGRAFPEDASVQEQLGRFYIRRSELGRAEELFRSILQRDAQNTSALTGLGAVHFERGQYADAEHCFREVLAQSRAAIAHTNLAWALVRQVEEDRPVAGQQPLEPEQADLLDRAERECRVALELYPSPAEAAEAFACLGVIAFKRGIIRDSQQYLRESIRVDPKQGHYVDLGALYVYTGHHEAAEEQLRRAHEIAPDDTQVHVVLGSLYLQLGKGRSSAREFRHATALSPHNPDGWQGLAIALMERGQFIEAEQALRDGVRLVDPPRRWALYLVLAQVLVRRGDAGQERRFYEEALDAVNEAVNLQPRHPDLFFQRAVVHYKLAGYASSLRDLRACHDLDPRQFEAERHARWIESQMRQQRASLRLGWLGSIGLGVTSIGILVAILVFYWTRNRPLDAVAGALIPVLLGFLVVASALPAALVRLKLPGLEAEFVPPKSKEAQELLPTGPKGEVKFVHSLSTGGSRLRFW